MGGLIPAQKTTVHTSEPVSRGVALAAPPSEKSMGQNDILASIIDGEEPFPGFLSLTVEELSERNKRWTEHRALRDRMERSDQRSYRYGAYQVGGNQLKRRRRF